MKYLLPMMLIFCLAKPASALEIQAPEVPQIADSLMPEETESFSDGLRELLQKALYRLHPDISDAVHISVCVTSAVLMLSILQTFSGNGKKAAIFAGTASIASILLGSANTMIALGWDTVYQLSSYGKLLFPVMTAALAAQGGVTSSAALYAGTAAFDALLASLIANVFLPMVYLFLALSIGNSALGEDLLKRLRDMLKNGLTWCLKTILTVFTTYMSITGVVSGSTDAAALKATRVTISTVVPVVGGILADASEAVLVSAGVMKSAAGVYGVLAILALFLGPFLRIGIHYLILKATAALSALLGPKEMTCLIEDFSTAMGLLLAMTGAV